MRDLAPVTLERCVDNTLVRPCTGAGLRQLDDKAAVNIISVYLSVTIAPETQDARELMLGRRPDLEEGLELLYPLISVNGEWTAVVASDL